MTSIKGSFSGKITKQLAMSPADQENHELSIAEVSGTQESPDPLWNNSNVTYWAVTDVVGGKGTQRGCFNNIGTFEGKAIVAGSKITVEGKFKFAGGDGELRGLTGGGTFKTVLKSESEIDCTWTGEYKLAEAKAQAR